MYLVKELFYKFVVLCLDIYNSFEKFIIDYAEGFFEALLNGILRKGGITVNGPKPYDPQVTRKKEFYSRVIQNATLGLGEGYMEQLWDVEDLEAFAYQGLKHNLTRFYLGPVNRVTNYLLFKAINLQTKERSFEVADKHYDLGNDLFTSFLDPTMSYSCGYWRNASNLHEAQIAKLDLIGRKLMLQPGMKVLDIGCGWGGLAKHLAENFGVEVVGCTISKEQAALASERCQGLPVEILVSDYRDINEKFDRIVSVGMFEHVGTDNYRTFFEVCNRCLKSDGVLLLHTIGVSHGTVPLIEPWFHKYIFPNGVLPYHTEIPKNIDGLFILEDWHNFSFDYSKTLQAWKANFIQNWPELSAKRNVGESFYRMWIYYLAVSAAAFRARKYQLWQIVMTKDGMPGGYPSVR